MSFCRGLIIMSVILASVSPTLPPPLHAQGTTGTIRGIVTRAAPDAPVAGAQVFIVGGRLGAVTGADGRYTFSQVPPGTHVVRVRALGFQPIEKSVEVTAGQAATADFVVTSTPVSLENARPASRSTKPPSVPAFVMSIVSVPVPPSNVSLPCAA